MGTITLRDAVNKMQLTGDMGRAVPFAAKWVRADRNKGTGGQIVEAKGITLLRNEKALPKSMRTQASRRDKGLFTRNRNRRSNATRDVYYNGREDCIHIYLLLELNGQTVI